MWSYAPLPLPSLPTPPLPPSLPTPPLPTHMQSRFDSHQGEAYVTISTLQEEREELVRIKEECQQYIRQLEQKNDDLERQMRLVQDRNRTARN